MNQAPPEDTRTSTAMMLDQIRALTGETARETELETDGVTRTIARLSWSRS